MHMPMLVSHQNWECH